MDAVYIIPTTCNCVYLCVTVYLHTYSQTNAHILVCDCIFIHIYSHIPIHIHTLTAGVHHSELSGRWAGKTGPGAPAADHLHDRALRPGAIIR